MKNRLLKRFLILFPILRGSTLFSQYIIIPIMFGEKYTVFVFIYQIIESVIIVYITVLLEKKLGLKIDHKARKDGKDSRD